jgi:hypothetical protein
MPQTKKIELDFLITCDDAILSKENKLSLIGIFDQIFVKKFPSAHSKMFVVGALRGNPGSDYSVKLKIEDSSSKEVMPTQEIKNNFGPNGGSNIIAELGNLPLSRAGAYKISLIAGKEVLGTRELNVFAVPGSEYGREKAGKYPN